MPENARASPHLHLITLCQSVCMRVRVRVLDSAAAVNITARVSTSRARAYINMHPFKYIHTQIPDGLVRGVAPNINRERRARGVATRAG